MSPFGYKMFERLDAMNILMKSCMQQFYFTYSKRKYATRMWKKVLKMKVMH